jgi:hypothetical protein
VPMTVTSVVVEIFELVPVENDDMSGILELEPPVCVITVACVVSVVIVEGKPVDAVDELLDNVLNGKFGVGAIPVLVTSPTSITVAKGILTEELAAAVVLVNIVVLLGVTVMSETLGTPGRLGLPGTPGVPGIPGKPGNGGKPGVLVWSDCPGIHGNPGIKSKS